MQPAEAIDKLAKQIRAGKVAVLCGAGISRNSGLPVVGEFESEIFDRLGATKQERSAILAAKLPFEAFVQSLGEYSRLDRLFEIFALGIPNANHLLLAKLVIAHTLETIVTTNFDQLIERSLGSENHDVQTLSQAADFGKVSRKWFRRESFLIKIHGGVEAPSEMAITLRQVASQTLLPSRKRVIDYLFRRGRHSTVLVLGYSASDVFDLCPQIEAVTNPRKRIIFVQHSDGSCLEPLARLGPRNPFRNFADGYRLSFNTDQLVQTLWSRFFPEDPFPEQRSMTNWKKYVSAWFDESRSQFKVSSHAILGLLLFEATNLPAARQRLREALGLIDEHDDRRMKIRCLHSLARVTMAQHEDREAIAVCQWALTLAQESGDRDSQVALLNTLGAGYKRIGRLGDALSSHDKARRVAEALNDESGVSHSLAYFASVHEQAGQYHLAIKPIREAIKIAARLGEKKLEGISLATLANAYNNMYAYRRAIHAYRKALDIARLIGDRRSEARTIGNLATVYGRRGDDAKAVSLLKEALATLRAIGSGLTEEEHILGNLGNAYYNMRDYENAARYYAEAVQVASQIFEPTTPFEEGS
jgi:tetratricopeptide (TPR) repeat protein